MYKKKFFQFPQIWPVYSTIIFPSTERITWGQNMSTLYMTIDRLFSLSYSTINSIEKILSKSLSFTNREIFYQLENDLGYSIDHIRSVFSFATNIGLVRYITRRTYTIILLNMSFEHFNKLPMQATIHGIYKFKCKCLQEFPLLTNSYSIEQMQPPINKSLLDHLLQKQNEKKWSEYAKKLYHQNITKNRTHFEIMSSDKN